MKPLHYTLHLEPDLAQFTFKGHVEIDLQAAEPVDQVRLDALDLEVQHCTVQMGKEVAACSFALDPAQQALRVDLPDQVGGEMRLAIDFTGQINDLLVGLYRSRYQHQGEERYVAVTQFEEREARRVFPCFDLPADKATFDVEFLIDAGLQGIANTPIREELPQPGGKKLVRFERTPRMSTYLLFFGIGEFEFIADNAKLPQIRVAATPGKVQYGEFALRMGRNAIDFGEAYTGIPFPIAKCDHIAVSDFAFGAMENYGAITYREDALLVYPDVTSKEALAGIASVIAHETAHMWFGDLVSPAAWKYIWLNESFATYFTQAITDHYYPEWRTWDTFMLQSVRGMMRDSLDHTPPIELPGDQDINIDSSSAPIIYSKGAAVIRMLAAYLGETKLRQGINHFLKQYQFDSANTEQYWAAFEAATGEPISEFAASWVHQPGYPLVTARREGDVLHLTQRRFTFSGAAYAQTWLIPLDVLAFSADGQTHTLRLLLREASATLQLPPNTVACKLNAGQTGFYRVEYDPASRQALNDLLRAGRLTPEDSFGLHNDLFALLCGGRIALGDYLSLVEALLASDCHPLPLYNAVESLLLLYQTRAAAGDGVARIGRALCERALDAVGLLPTPDDSMQTAALRDMLLRVGFIFGSERVRDFGLEQFTALLSGAAVPADILDSVLGIGAATHPQALEYMMARLSAAETPETERVMLLGALGCFRDEATLRTVLDFNLQSVPKKNRVNMIARMVRNPVAVPFLWEWFQAHFAELQTLHPAHISRLIVTVLPLAGLGHEDEVRAFLDGMTQQVEAARDTNTMTLEILAAYSQLRRAA